MDDILISDIDIMFSRIMKATDVLGPERQNEMMQIMAYKMEEWYFVSRDDLRRSLENVNIRMEELCVGCKEPLPISQAIGDIICEYCKGDVDSVS